MFVCICMAVCEREVRACIRAGARDVDEVGEACAAGTGCGSCHDHIQTMLSAGHSAADVAGLPATA